MVLSLTLSVSEEQQWSVNKIIEASLTAPAESLKNAQQANAKLAIIFEAIKLALLLDAQSENVRKAINILSPFISSKETNFRYVGLDVMSYFVGFRETREAISAHLETILQSLRDKDISVQRRALYLLFCMCDTSNSEYIVKELMLYFQIANFEIHDELVLKIAILAEKFAKNYAWFLDVILELINIAGEHVGDEVWFRIVQIVTNHEEIREYAASKILQCLRQPSCNEKTLKLGGYILGEYGHMVANLPGSSPLEQFLALHTKFRSASSPTRSLLLSAYLKMVNVFPEIKNEIIRVFKQYTHALEVELQQRASEYLSIIEMDTDEVLQAVCDEMPPFPARPNILVSQLELKFKDTSDKKGLKFLEQDKSIIAKRDIIAVPTNDHGLSTPADPSPVMEKKGSVNLLDLNDDAVVEPASTFVDPSQFINKLLLENTGVLYEDDTLQIGLKTEYRNNMGKMAVFVGNKLSGTLNGVQCRADSQGPVRFNVIQPLASVLPAVTQLHQLFDLECVGVPAELPSFQFSFQKPSGQVQTLDLQLPVTVCKFMVPVQLNATNFLERWRQIGGPPREFQATMTTSHSIESIREILGKLHLEVLEGMDPNPSNIVSAGIFCSTELGKVGCLVRVEKIDSVRVFHSYHVDAPDHHSNYK